MKWLKRIVLMVVALALLGALSMRHIVTASLPELDGEITLAGLSAPVTVARDALGVPTLRGSNRIDLSYALGFVHAQERFFQMDLLRRRAAGELSSLVGAGALGLDRRHRLHRMRARAEQGLAATPPENRRLLDAYTAGVNAGLEALGSAPFEYWLLRQEPRPWRAEDSLLAVAAMYFELNDAAGSYESTVGLVHDVLPSDLAAFLTPVGTDWDAPVDGDVIHTPEVPSSPKTMEAAPSAADGILDDGRENVGSNNWAVAGSKTRHGGALLASDMHLGHSVPNIWFRARLEWGEHRVIGVTLPGTPSVVSGSNTHIAWGFTNSNGDWVDLVIVETNPDDPSTYRTPGGWRAFDVYDEPIELADGTAETIEVRETIWGPVIDTDHRGRAHAVRWIAHEPKGINANLARLETARDVEEAIAIASTGGIPPQNFVCADASGAIAWTIAGPIPKRFGFDGRVPTSWADGARGWDGWVDESAYPVLRSPDTEVIWTANARVVGGDMLATIGDGGYAFGARARQIRDDLLALDAPDERDMLDIQLDDRALFLSTWRDYFLGRLEDGALRDVIANDWSGRASPESAAYRIVRDLRLAILREVYETLTADARTAEPDFSIGRLRQWDGPLWKLVQTRPEHLVPDGYESWDAWMADIVDRTVASWDGALVDRTWGERQMASIRHPLSPAVPWLSRWLDMPSVPLRGDSNVPRAQSASHGASQRMVVSPGREADGLFHMPGGQSGHPLSPYYGAGHDDWVEGRPAPLLPGEPVYSLTLRP